MENKSWRFVIAFTLCFAVALIGYGFFYRFKVVRDPTVVPVSYKQLLLEQVKGPRVIIESGSNGLHAFDGELVEELTGYPTIILADHAGASLHDKIQRLIKYTVPGDIVLLPLEWNYYHAPDLSENHLKSIVDRGRGYYYSLPFTQQCQRAYSAPFAMVIAELLQPKDVRKTDFATELERLDYFEKHNLQFAPFGEAAIGPQTKRLPADSDCDSYILPEFANGPIAFTSEFRDSLRMLSRLKDKNDVTVILTAPVVVGRGCYERYGGSLIPMVEEVKALCDQLGILHLLDFERYALSEEYLLDTHFHITTEGAKIITPLVIGDGIENGWIVPQTLKPESSTAKQIPGILETQLLELLNQYLPTWRGNPMRIHEGYAEGIFHLGDDWYPEEEWGRWAAKARSKIIVKPDPARVKQVTGVYINANYYHGSQKTAVYLNGSLIGTQDFTENHLLELNQPLESYLLDNPLAVFEFVATERVSPKDVEGSTDQRLLKFGIHSLELVVSSVQK